MFHFLHILFFFAYILYIYFFFIFFVSGHVSYSLITKIDIIRHSPFLCDTAIALCATILW